MKREDLNALGITDAAQLDKIMELHGASVEKHKGSAATLTAERDGLKAQLAEAGKTIEGFKALDIDGIKAAADDWKAKAEQAQKDAEAQVAAVKFDALLNGAIGTAKGRSAKAVKALLDVDALKASKNQEVDLQAALAELAKSDAYLFDTGSTPPPYAAGTGTGAPGAGENDALRAAMGLPAAKN